MRKGNNVEKIHVLKQRQTPRPWPQALKYEISQNDRQRRRDLGAVIQKAGDAKLRSGDARGACEVYLKVTKP